MTQISQFVTISGADSYRLTAVCWRREEMHVCDQRLLAKENQTRSLHFGSLQPLLSTPSTKQQKVQKLDKVKIVLGSDSGGSRLLLLFLTIPSR
jgi:hypothetical protein